MASILALPLAGVWWFGSALLSGGREAVCDDSLAADLSFVAANFAFLIAAGALVAAALRQLEVASGLLVGYLALFAASALVFFTCD